MIVFNIEEYGAKADGRTLNTAAIQKAVDACAAQGGGRVHVPAGVFVSGPIFLKSNIEFHLSAGATLQGSRTMTDYPFMDFKSHGYHIHDEHASLLTAIQMQNVSITGKGVLDGQGDVWWEARDVGKLKAWRPMVVYLCDCERVLIDGLKIVNSPCYNILPMFCRNMTINDVSIKNPWKPYFNCDGIDLVSCNNVRISNCHVDTGDDGICLKSVPGHIESYSISPGMTPPTDYTKPHIPCENILITNCVVEHAHGGLTLGAEVVGGIRNVTLSNCIFDGTRAGIRIWRMFTAGGFVENIRVDNVVMRRVEWVFAITGQGVPPEQIEKVPGVVATPAYRNIHFSNITATKARIACEALSFPEVPLRDISFSNIHIQADKGFDIRNAGDILLDNVVVECPGPALLAENVRNLEVRRLIDATPQAGIPSIQLTNVQDAWIHGCKAVAGTDTFLGLVGDENRDIRLGENELSKAARAQANIPPCPDWNIDTHAYCGSSMGRCVGDKNPFLPVPPSVMETIRRELPLDLVDRVRWLSRVESGARPGVDLEPGDRRRMYIVEDDTHARKLIICEDGELLRVVDDPEFHVWCNY